MLTNAELHAFIEQYHNEKGGLKKFGIHPTPAFIKNLEELDKIPLIPYMDAADGFKASLGTLDNRSLFYLMKALQTREIPSKRKDGTFPLSERIACQIEAKLPHYAEFYKMLTPLYEAHQRSHESELFCTLAHYKNFSEHYNLISPFLNKLIVKLDRPLSFEEFYLLSSFFDRNINHRYCNEGFPTLIAYLNQSSDDTAHALYHLLKNKIFFFSDRGIKGYQVKSGLLHTLDDIQLRMVFLWILTKYFVPAADKSHHPLYSKLFEVLQYFVRDSQITLMISLYNNSLSGRSILDALEINMSPEKAYIDTLARVNFPIYHENNFYNSNNPYTETIQSRHISNFDSFMIKTFNHFNVEDGDLHHAYFETEWPKIFPSISLPTTRIMVKKHAHQVSYLHACSNTLFKVFPKPVLAKITAHVVADNFALSIDTLETMALEHLHTSPRKPSI